ncbi:probable G-protein coupled receptor 158 isoform X1 [Diorhabda sublineata]|uniref:probable G-protein coupled receptor 158 isoform X1 n=1 Tax=Diorhabda sublineata TaxID=1163346 RepID=UPI0024E0AD56|nr:probable G-protein coupled receptor 158 isoform X1 [Diorhabda sublineata]
MNAIFFYLPLFLISARGEYPNNHDHCQSRILPNPTIPTRLNINLNYLLVDINKKFGKLNNITALSREILQNDKVLGVIFFSNAHNLLALNVSKRLKIFYNRTAETETFRESLNVTKNGWGKAFKDCDFLKTWVYPFTFTTFNTTIGLFIQVDLNQCDDGLADIFNGSHNCNRETMLCLRNGPPTEKNGNYRCVCQKGYYNRRDNFSWNGEDIEIRSIDIPRCIPCPEGCQFCDPSGVCGTRQDVYLKTVILCIQLICMAITVILGLIVFKQRKTKAIASSMWKILETILLGIFILYATAVVKSFEPSVVQCLLEPWVREVGFIICYGAIILKLYRHLIEFRTRKAHRWVVKDTDLLKYLLIMSMSVLAYMAAYTSITLNFIQENYSLLFLGRTLHGERYYACKSLWWDYVTEIGELVILIFGIHLSYASRNARTQFHERTFLCAAISLELASSTLFYVARILILPGLHPDLVLIIYCIRTQISQTMALLLIFVPKFWYQQKQVRNLAQEYSCRLPVDAFKDVNAHGPLTGNNSDVEVGEVTLADMSPDDIRAELKRLYLQLEIFKSKTLCRDNPHISKRRGGRKAQHRRFSLQKKGSREKNLHGKHKEKDKYKQQEEITEAEPSRTPEDSVCSNEGPSAIYADLPSITTHSDHK